MSKRVSTYLTDRTLAVIGDAASTSGGLNQAVDRYGEIVRRHRAVEKLFTEAELNALRDVCNGWAAEPAATIAGGVALELEDAIPDGVAAKWGIDAGALLAKLRSIAYADEVALVAGIEAYWRAKQEA